MNYRYCPNCGSQIDATASFCPKCGKPTAANPFPYNNPPTNTRKSHAVLILLLSTLIGIAIASGVYLVAFRGKTTSRPAPAVQTDTVYLPQPDTTEVQQPAVSEAPAVAPSRNSVETPAADFPKHVIVAGDNVCLRSQAAEKYKLPDLIIHISTRATWWSALGRPPTTTRLSTTATPTIYLRCTVAHVITKIR